jgi:hypothetical protein
MSGKKMVKRFTCLLAMIVSLAGYASGGESIVGKWKSVDGIPAVYTFAEDGTGTVVSMGAPMTLTWKTEGDLLKMTISLPARGTLAGVTQAAPPYEYKVSGSTLTLTNPVDKKSGTFNKVE